MRVASAMQHAIKVPNTMPLFTLPTCLVLTYLPRLIQTALLLPSADLKLMLQAPVSLDKPDDACCGKLYNRLGQAHLKSVALFPLFASAVIVAVVLRANPIKLMPFLGRWMGSRFLLTVLCLLEAVLVEVMGDSLPVTLATTGLELYSVRLIFSILYQGLSNTPPPKKQLAKK